MGPLSNSLSFWVKVVMNMEKEKKEYNKGPGSNDTKTSFMSHKNSMWFLSRKREFGMFVNGGTT